MRCEGVIDWRCPAPPRALTLTLSRRAGEGRFAVYERSSAMSGAGEAVIEGLGCLVWQGRFETCPYIWDVRMDRQDWMLLGEGCAAPFVLWWGGVFRGR